MELANAAYGQGETFVTPLQMALVASTIADRGELQRPRLVTALIGRNGSHDIGPQSLRRVIDPGDADAITQAMTQAVEGPLGGAQPAAAHLAELHAEALAALVPPAGAVPVNVVRQFDIVIRAELAAHTGRRQHRSDAIGGGQIRVRTA